MGRKTNAKKRRAREREERKALGVRRPGPLRLGVDVQVSYRDLDYFRTLGFEVVVLARTGETDESWVARAHACEADVLCSNDRGVRARAWALGLHWIDIPEGLKRGGIRHAIGSRAQQLIKQDLVELDTAS